MAWRSIEEVEWNACPTAASYGIPRVTNNPSKRYSSHKLLIIIDGGEANEYFIMRGTSDDINSNCGDIVIQRFSRYCQIMALLAVQLAKPAVR